MRKFKLLAIILVLSAVVSSSLEFYFLPGLIGSLGYLIGIFDAAILVGIAFFLWNKS